MKTALEGASNLKAGLSIPSYSSIGRFLNRDPIGFAGGLNLFEYAGSSPVTMVDPFGLRQLPTADPSGDTDIGRGLVKIGTGAATTQTIPILVGPDDLVGGALIMDGVKDVGTGILKKLIRKFTGAPGSQPEPFVGPTRSPKPSPSPGPSPPCDDDPNNAYVYRTANGFETRTRLHGKGLESYYGPYKLYGVSGTVVRPMDMKNVNRASLQALKSAGFPVVPTGMTGHVTIVLGRDPYNEPISDSKALQFNALFGLSKRK